VIGQLDGVELPARAWERDVLPARVEPYERAMLDMLCLSGDVGWARLSSGPTQVVGATPIALFLREHADDWWILRGADADDDQRLSDPARRLLDRLRTHGASFAAELRNVCELAEGACRDALAELVAAGLTASDGFAGVRAIVSTQARRGLDTAGRWSSLRRDSKVSRDEAMRTLAWTLLARYGVVFRRVLARETSGVPWREMARIYRSLEARGEIRGGRFVSGMSGEQFALPEAVGQLRAVRRQPVSGRLVAVGAADPLNLTGIVTPGERVAAVARSRVLYRDGVPVLALERGEVRPLGAASATPTADIVQALVRKQLTPALRARLGIPLPQGRLARRPSERKVASRSRSQDDLSP
jgi:ATP-dependent Lhr-like helicase